MPINQAPPPARSEEKHHVPTTIGVVLGIIPVPELWRSSRVEGGLHAAGVATQGEPVLARYNAPFKPWLMRRNEIWLALH